MPRLTITGKELVSGNSLANQRYTIIGMPDNSANMVSILVGGPETGLEGQLDSNGESVIDDIPASPEGSWLAFDLVDLGTRYQFIMPSNDTSLSARWLAFRQPDAVGPVEGPPGGPGDNGWTPELASVNDGNRRVHQVADWFGGEGPKPPIGQYVGPNGFVINIADANNIRGEAGQGVGTGLTSVSTDGTLTGDGTPTDRLKVSNPFTAADESKLDAIEDNATEDQTGTEIISEIDDTIGTDWKTPGGGGPNSGLTSVATDITIDGDGTPADPLNVANEFTQNDEIKLDGIETNAQRNVGQTYTQTEKDKLAGIEAGAEENVGHEFTNADRSKLSNIESSATRDQSGTEIVGLIDTQLGNDDWQTPGTGGEGGSSTFTGLTDTPSAFGTTGQVPVVNAAGNALEFADQTGGEGGGGSGDN